MHITLVQRNLYLCYASLYTPDVCSHITTMVMVTKLIEMSAILTLVRKCETAALN